MPKKHRYFFDTEFIENGKSVQLISIGIVDETGKEYYAVSNEYNYDDASDWVKENVIEPMYKEFIAIRSNPPVTVKVFQNIIGLNKKQIGKEIVDFVRYSQVEGTEIEFWGYYSDYDWVVLCQLFGTMMDLPPDFPMFCMDLKQSMIERCVEKLPDPVGEHNALIDARFNRDLYNHIYNETSTKENVISLYGKKLVSFGEMLQDENSTIDSIVKASFELGLMVAIKVEPLEEGSVEITAEIPPK